MLFQDNFLSHLSHSRPSFSNVCTHIHTHFLRVSGSFSISSFLHHSFFLLLHLVSITIPYFLTTTYRIPFLCNSFPLVTNRTYAPLPQSVSPNPQEAFTQLPLPLISVPLSPWPHRGKGYGHILTHVPFPSLLSSPASKRWCSVS